MSPYSNYKPQIEVKEEDKLRRQGVHKPDSVFKVVITLGCGITTTPLCGQPGDKGAGDPSPA